MYPSIHALSRRVALLGAIAALALVACADDNPQAGPPADAAVDAVPIDACVAGSLGCACDAGACNEGRCADEVCVACPEGTERCPCGPGDACGDGLRCAESECVADACPAGQRDCPCDVGDACDDGLACVAGACVAVEGCAPGTVDCMCTAGQCDGALVCLDSVCRDCPADAPGCPCVDEACEGGLICDAGACRVARDCVDLGCVDFQDCDLTGGACLDACTDGRVWDGAACVAEETPPTCADVDCAAANRACVEDAAGAVCGDCLDGFVVEGGACVRDLQSNCNADPADPQSILAACEAQDRVCVADGDGATCGDCIDGFVVDPSIDACAPVDAFGACDVEADCPVGLFCTGRRPAEEPRCLPAACGAGETFDLRAGACTDRCNCDAPGQTGAPWPVTDWNGDCVCETAPGWFFNTSAGSRRAEQCDADGDGWTRRSAFAHINAADDAVRLNARCDLRTVDEIVLVNEYGQALPLSVETLSGGRAGFEPLYETDESDDDLEALERQAGPYGARRFGAAELNPLTKACATPLDDFNDNGISDVREHHREQPDPQKSWMATFVGASYFVELHTGRYEAPAAGGAHGRYVITERSRCDAAFPLRYDPSEGPYAASCARRRDRGYTPAEPIGYDFQRWSCANPDGACAMPDPPVARSLDGVPAHGLCDADPGEDPVEWRGMGHASQFKCVEIVSDQEPAIEPFQRPRSAVQIAADGAARLSLNACTLGDAVAVDPADPNPAHPAVTCDAEVAVVTADREALIGTVGFVALRYDAYDAAPEYAGGCINEAVEWPELCPGFDPDVRGATISEGNPGNFGKLICGCGLNYGGPGCDQGCPDDQLHFGGPHRDVAGCVDGYCVTAPDDSGLDGGRRGFWMCGDFGNLSYQQHDPEHGGALHGVGALTVDGERRDGVITIRGTIPTFGTDGTPLCAQVDEDGRCSGFTIR